MHRDARTRHGSGHGHGIAHDGSHGSHSRRTIMAAGHGHGQPGGGATGTWPRARARLHARGRLVDARSGGALALTATFMVVEAVAGVVDRRPRAARRRGPHAGGRRRRWCSRSWRASGRSARARRRARSAIAARRSLAAFVNGIALAVTAIAIVIEAVERWRAPPDIRAAEMLAFATSRARREPRSSR